LINFLDHVGFSSIYECFNPPHINSGMPGIEHKDRCTFVAIKGKKLNMLAAPATDSLDEDWPEGSLTYAYRSKMFLYAQYLARVRYFLRALRRRYQERRRS
jgi:hypothetical protein